MKNGASGTGGSSLKLKVDIKYYYPVIVTFHSALPWYILTLLCATLKNLNGVSKMLL